MFAPRPKPKRESVPLERLTFSAQLQMRDLPDGALFDPATVKTYVEALEDDAQFPPLEAVCEKPKGKQPVFWVFGGFTRGEAYRQWGKANSVDVLVYEGTFADAQFYALSENRKHGAQSTHGDKTKAVCALLDTPALMSRVTEAARKGGGLAKAIAEACGVSYSLVTTKILPARGLSVEGLKLVPRQPAAQSNKDSTFATSGKTQTPVTKTPDPASPAPTPTEDPNDSLFSVPPDFTPAPELLLSPPPAPAPSPEPVTSEAQALPATVTYDDDRLLADQVVRGLRAVQDDLAKLLSRPGGALLLRCTIGTNPQFERRAVDVKGQSPRMAWYSRQLASVEQAVMRTRPKAVCAGCRGAKCAACRGCGFVPSDETLVGSGAPAELDFGDPFAAEAVEKGGGL